MIKLSPAVSGLAVGEKVGYGSVNSADIVILFGIIKTVNQVLERGLAQCFTPILLLG